MQQVCGVMSTIISFCDDYSLNALQLSDRGISAIISKHKRDIASAYAQQYASSRAIFVQYEQAKSTLEIKKTQQVALILLRDETANKLAASRSIWMGRLVELLGGSSPLTTLIRFILEFLSNQFREQVALHRTLSISYETTIRQIGELEREFPTLQQKIEDLDSSYVDQLTKDDARIKICDAFGGKKKFEQLPVLENITDIEDFGLRGYENIIRHLMTDPIMRGMDGQGREFFILRGIRSDSDHIWLQCYYNRGHGGVWFTTGGVFTPGDGDAFIASYDVPGNRKRLAHLKNAVSSMHAVGDPKIVIK